MDEVNDKDVFIFKKETLLDITTALESYTAKQRYVFCFTL